MTSPLRHLKKWAISFSSSPKFFLSKSLAISEVTTCGSYSLISSRRHARSSAWSRLRYTCAYPGVEQRAENADARDNARDLIVSDGPNFVTPSKKKRA